MKKKIIIGVLGIMVGLWLGLIYGHVQLATEQKVHQAKLKEINQRLSMAQRRYSEEKSHLEDDSLAVQAQLDTLGKEKERLTLENGQLKAKLAALETASSALEKKVASVEARANSADAKNKDLAERLAKVETDRAALDRKQQQTFQTLQEREKELKQLTADSQAKYNQCAEHNARLCIIAEELVHKYENKGVVKTLLSKEPITQIQKVELEKLVQDYKDRIDQHKIGSK